MSGKSIAFIIAISGIVGISFVLFKACSGDPEKPSNITDQSVLLDLEKREKYIVNSDDSFTTWISSDEYETLSQRQTSMPYDCLFEPFNSLYHSEIEEFIKHDGRFYVLDFCFPRPESRPSQQPITDNERIVETCRNPVLFLIYFATCSNLPK